MMPPRRERPCITPECKSKQHARGLCMGCYTRMQNAVMEKTTTEEQLMAAGLLLPKYGKRNSHSPFTRAVAKLQENEGATPTDG